MVSSYLVHHGYCSTATAFARVTDTTIQEEQTSIKNRQSKSLECHSSSVLPLGLCRGVRAVEFTPWAYRAAHRTLLTMEQSSGTSAGSTFPIITVPSPPTAIFAWRAALFLPVPVCSAWPLPELRSLCIRDPFGFEFFTAGCGSRDSSINLGTGTHTHPFSFTAAPRVRDSSSPSAHYDFR